MRAEVRAGATLADLMCRREPLVASEIARVRANLTRHGVEIIHGAARFEDPHTLRLDTPDGARRARRSSCWRPDPRPTGRTASRSTIRKLVGAHIVGERATELIHIASTGLALGATLETFIDAVYNFPTLSQLYKYAAYDALGKLPGGSSILPAGGSP